MTTDVTTCPRCAATTGVDDRFCGGCGACLADVRRVAIPRSVAAADSACADCGNTTFVDDYCSACGHRRAAPDRDQADLAGIVLITDRGHEHHRNEDAAAAGVLTGTGGAPSAFALVVSDGVSTSEDPQLASGAAVAAGVDAMLAALAAARDSRSAVVAGLTEATAAAAAAQTGTDPAMAPSCTYTAAVVVPSTDGAQIAMGNVGDSRVYWLPEKEADASQLTVDDSLSQELMATGLAADSPAVLRGAHTITRWLGADSEPQPWADSSVQVVTVTGPGVVLLCSDGLWNYLPGADDLARFCAGKQPAAAAHELVEFALGAGGQDNITVVVLPVGGPS